MGRRLLLCAPLVSATLVGCLLRPGGHAASGDGGVTADGMNRDGPPAQVCTGEGSAVDPLTSPPCGSGFGSAFGSSHSVTAQGGTLTATANMGTASCSWNIFPDASFAGVTVHLTAVASQNGQAFLSYADGNATYMLGAQYGSTLLATGGSWSPQGSPPQLPASFCARLHVVPASGSGGSMLEGQVDTGSGWQTVATGYFDVQPDAELSLGVQGMSASAMFDHFDYVAP